MTFYDDIKLDVVDILTEFGQLGTLRHGGSDHTVKFAVVDYSLDAFGTGMIMTGDRHVYMEATSFEPKANEDLLYIQGKAHNIIPPVKKVDPAGTVVLYELQVRG